MWMLNSRQRHCLRRWLLGLVAPVVFAPGSAAVAAGVDDGVGVVAMIAPGQLPHQVSLVSFCF